METSFTCRAATFDTLLLMCYISRYTLETNPNYAATDDDFDYLENECLTGKCILSHVKGTNTRINQCNLRIVDTQRCQGDHVYVVEENKELLGGKDLVSFETETAISCAAKCKDRDR